MAGWVTWGTSALEDVLPIRLENSWNNVASHSASRLDACRAKQAVHAEAIPRHCCPWCPFPVPMLLRNGTHQTMPLAYPASFPSCRGYDFLSLEHLDFSWQISVNGMTIESGKLPGSGFWFASYLCYSEELSGLTTKAHSSEVLQLPTKLASSSPASWND